MDCSVQAFAQTENKIEGNATSTIEPGVRNGRGTRLQAIRLDLVLAFDAKHSIWINFPILLHEISHQIHDCINGLVQACFS